MKQIKATQNERLDTVVFREYKSLDNFGKVLEQNKHLQNKAVLSDGDIINLPILETVIKKEVSALW